MRAFWKKDGVVCLKLKENLYTLAQMVDESAYMRFYAISNHEDVWGKIDLNTVAPLFCVSVGNALIQHLGVRRVPDKEVIPSHAPFERYFIKPNINYEGPFVYLGGKLIDKGENAQEDMTRAPVKISDLSVSKHLDVIHQHELTPMWGDKDSAARLIHFFETGENFNGLKEAVFPELEKIDHHVNRDTETYRAIKKIYATKP
ncbi:hypothetical protein AAKU64_003079 [Undibacterium sp. GrIS 1.8]|uniref:hypothetical protein n=1 Tax=unclassified Undibacterium TaxID=2630295 RepID=UPI00339606EE